MAFKDAFLALLKIKYPIIQAPMLGVSTPEMAAVVANEGGLGSLAVGGLSPEITRELIRKTKSLTNKPFAVNLFAHAIPAYVANELEPMKNFIQHLAAQRGYVLADIDIKDFKFYNHLDQIDILVEEGIGIVSFTFGCLDEQNIRKLKDSNCILIGTATCVEEAICLQQQNIDMIVAQGIEAGGHRGTFLTHIPLPEVGLFSLLPQIKSAVNLPIIAAGGINSVQAIKAAFDLGADAVQIGTAFIGTEESIAIAAYKYRLNHAKDADTVLTRAFSGRWARGIRNKMMQEIEQSDISIPPYPLQNSLTASFRKLAQQNNDSDYTNLWAGQSDGMVAGQTTKQVFSKLIEWYENF